jgi:hypothetical protein
VIVAAFLSLVHSRNPATITKGQQKSGDDHRDVTHHLNGTNYSRLIVSTVVIRCTRARTWHFNTARWLKAPLGADIPTSRY